MGPALTSPPYSFNWDSTGASNGPHSITARAWDAAGNTTTSGAVSITVSNRPAPVISSVAAGSLSTSSAAVNWTTDEPADSQIDYGPTAALRSVRSVASGSGAVSGDFTFTTAAAAPSFRSRTTATNGFTVAKPAGVAAGDLLLASLEVDADPATVTAPAGWTLLLDTKAGAGTAKVFHSQVWYRVAGSSEPATYTWAVGGSPYTDIAVLAYANVNSTTPVDAASGRDAGSTSSPTTPAVSTAYSNEMLVALFIDWDYGTWAAGSGMTKRYDFDSLTAQDSVSALPGAVTPKTATSTASGPTTAQIVTLRGQ